MKYVKAWPLAALGWLAGGTVTAAELPPAPGAPHEFTLPGKETLRLDNGLRVTFLDYGSVPKVTLLAVVRTGAIDEGSQTWLSDVTAEMMKEGTTTRSAADIARQAAEMGGELQVGAGAEQFTVGLSVLSEHATDAAALVADVLRRPRLPASELPRIEANFERNLSIALREPGALAGQALARMLYGDHPFGHVLPEPGQLDSYTIDDVQRFYSRNFGAARTHVYLAGRFDRRALEAALRQALDDWPAGPAPTDNPPSPASKRRLELIERAGAPQSSLRMAVPAPDPTQPDFLPFTLTNTLLGGYFSSRITTNIREDKGYTYSPGSSIRSYRHAASWVMSADVTTEHTADSLREIYKEIARLAAEPPRDEELQAVKNYRAGLFVISNSSPDGLLGQLAYMDLHGLPDDYLTQWVERIYAVRPTEVSALVQRWIDPARMTVVVVGDLDKVADSVRSLPQLRDARQD